MRHLVPERHGHPAEEAAFLALGSGAAAWLTYAAASGARRIRPKMAEAVTLTKLHPAAEVDQALGIAAIAGELEYSTIVALRRADQAHDERPACCWRSAGSRDH
ncbi:hypothetical protein [Amycolatopsis sp. NPDC054798]